MNQNTQSQTPATAQTPYVFKKSALMREFVGYIIDKDGFEVASVDNRDDSTLEENLARADFILRAVNSHAALARAWSELAYHANVLANAKTKAERAAASLRVFSAIGDAKHALPELRTLQEARASAKEGQP